MEVIKKETEENGMKYGTFQDNEILEDGLGQEDETGELDNDYAGEEDEIKTSGTFTLTEALKTGEEEIKKIHYDFLNVKPIQYINICKAIGKKESVTVPELNMNVQFTVFCRAAGIPVSVLKRVETLQDFTAMCQMARDFLLSKQGQSEDLL